jgi:hypothetical protein
MKRLIITDAQGNIIATGPHPDDVRHADHPQEGRFGFLPLEGQAIHEVELPEHVQTIEHIQQLHKSHRVTVENGVAKLIERKTAE